MSKQSSEQNSLTEAELNPVRSHDLFQDPTIAKSIDEDPVARFILTHWKNLLLLVCAIFGLFYVRSQFKSTSDARVAEASETFDRARSSVFDYIAKQEEKGQAGEKKDEASKIEENEKLLRSARDSLSALKSGPSPYSLLSPVYEQILDSETNANSVNLDLNNLSWNKESDDAKRLILEIQALSNARRGLDLPEQNKTAISMLLSLAKESKFVNAPAILTLLRVVETKEDMAAARSAAEDIIKQYPESSEKIEVELKRIQS